MPARVLVVEDEPLIGDDLVYMATRLGFETYGPAVAFNSALMVAADNPPDLAIVDVNLIDGPTGAAIASQLAKNFGTLVLIVTANPDLVMAGVGGVAAVLPKPYDPVQLTEALMRLSARTGAALPTQH